jgi:hypothetical protein
MPRPHFLKARLISPLVWRYIRTLRTFAEKVLNTVDAGIILPNVAAILRACPNHVNQRPLWGKARQSVDPGLKYFLAHFVSFEKNSKARQFRAANDLFGFARLFHPLYARDWVNGAESGTPPFNLNEELSRPAVSEVLLSLGPSICHKGRVNYSAKSAGKHGKSCAQSDGTNCNSVKG